MNVSTAADGNGGPEPGSPLSERQVIFLSMVGALTVVAILSLRIGNLWTWAWESQGLGRLLVTTTTAGINIDFAVLFPFGLVTGWVLLFTLDQTKDLQRWIAVVAYICILLLIVFFESRWTKVAWGSFWYIVVVGFITGVGVVIAPKLVNDRQKRVFPLAAAGLFAVSALLCIVAFLDVYFFGTAGMVSIENTLLPGPHSIFGMIVDAISVTSFLILFGWFVLYSDYRSIAILSGSSPLGIGVMAGLLDLTQQEYGGTTVAGGKILGEAKMRLGKGRLPDLDHRYFEFNYFQPTPPSRQIRVSAVPIPIDDIKEQTIQDIGHRAENVGLLSRTSWFFVDNLLPNWIRRKLVSNTGLLIDTIINADTLLFVTSVPEFEGYEPGTAPEARTVSAPMGVKKFITLCEQLDDSRENIIVVTEAEKALESTRATSVTDDALADYLRRELLDIGSEFSVVPVSWNEAETKEEQIMIGAEYLRKRIEG